MPSDLLQTKLYIPPVRATLIPRSRLINQLNEGATRKLTLIAAPAGFGKTTLLSEWIAQHEHLVAWLSLDERDNDPIRFLRYVIAALQTCQADVGAEALSLLHALQPPSIESILTTLINELATRSDRFILVLDDYHQLDTPSIDDSLTFLLNHLPTQLRLIIISRSDPNLPLARLRGQGELLELRAGDLRFTPTEAADFLHQATRLSLSVEEIAALETRTEGWITGLQLVALSMQGHPDTADFIQAFTGSHRFVLDYLVEEVLERQSESVRLFLLQTAILTRLNGDLCDVITETNDSKAMLAALERDNLFIIPLDDTRHWYRYHHLFADVLQVRLRETMPERVSTLHQQASHWYEQYDFPADAIHHAFAAGAFERAASLIQRAWPIMRQSYQEAILLEWVGALPEEMLDDRPILSVYYANALLSGNPNIAETHLQRAEQWLDKMTNNLSDRQIATISQITTEEEIESLPGMIAVVRAYQAGALRDVSKTIAYAQQALSLLPETDYLYRGSAAVLLALSQWSQGDLDAASKAIANSLTIMKQSDNISAAISTAYILADIQLAQGHLRQANGTVQQALKLATDHGKPVPQGTADLYVLLSEIACEQNDLEIAHQHLLTSQALGSHAALQVARHRWAIAMARIKVAHGDFESALALLDEAEQLHTGSPAPDVAPISALKPRIWLRQGRLIEAQAWMKAQSLSLDDEPTYLQEFEHITLVRVHIARNQNDPINHTHDVEKFLNRLLNAAEAGKRGRSLIELLILKALFHQLQQDIPAALESLHRALTLAEPEGYIRLFANEGAPMTHLLREALSRGITPSYTQQLLAACSTQVNQIPPSISTDQTPLIEPLSERELEVLHLIDTGLSNRDIAQQLYLSLNTVKAHTRNIYGKLDVHTRTQAVARARALSLLSTD
ncbi:MAG: LuxR C-terminal-related transcriptional regulator [Chloroflexota bacterium]